MGVVFLCGAIVQYNDPDPFRWGLVYLAAALLSFLSLRHPLPVWLPAATGAAAFAWAIGIALGVDASVYRSMFDQFGMASLEIEEAREALGLVIIAAWMLTVAFISRDRSSGS